MKSSLAVKVYWSLLPEMPVGMNDFGIDVNLKNGTYSK